MQINARHIHIYGCICINIYIWWWWWWWGIYLRGGGWRWRREGWRLELLLHQRGAEEWTERHLNWTGLASRGRWRTDVKFLKLFLFKKKEKSQSNQSTNQTLWWFTANSCFHWLIFPPPMLLFFLLFFFIIVAITIDMSSFFTFISQFSWTAAQIEAATPWNVSDAPSSRAAHKTQHHHQWRNRTGFSFLFFSF